VKKVWLILFSSAIICSSAAAQPFVILDSTDGVTVCGGASAGSPFNVYISICNSDSVQSSFRIVLGLSSRFGGSIVQPNVIFLNGIETNFPPLTVVFEGPPSDLKLIIQGSNPFPSFGIPISADTIPYFKLTFTLPNQMADDSLCIDSTSSTTYGDWQFARPTQPDWSGSSCYYVWLLPNCGPSITNCPLSLNYSYCGHVQYDFNGSSLCGGPVLFQLAGGPGSINPQNGLWSFTLGPGNVNDTFLIEVRACDDICGNGTEFNCGISCEVEVQINGGPPDNYPEYLGSQRFRFVAVSAETLSVQLQVTDPDPVNNHEFSWYTGPLDPVPAWASINDSTGQFKYYGETADTGLYWIFNSVSECGDGDSMGFYIYHFENYTCGDLNHDGNSGNILDLNWIIDYIFRGGPTPAPMQAGNVNCQPGVNTVDLNYLVNRIFRDGPPPCAACP